MKFYSPLLLLLYASLLCFTTAYNHGYPLSLIRKTDSRGVEHPNDKATAVSVQDKICSAALITEQCVSGFLKANARVAAKFNSTSGIRYYQDTCSSNAVGRFCGVFGFETAAFENITKVCGRSPTCCTPECRDTIITARATLGCCVSILNDTSSPSPFFYSLWSLCGVEPVTEQCKKPSFGFPMEAPKRTPYAFNQQNQQLHSRVWCRTEFLESQLQALRDTEGCEEYKVQYYSAHIETCAANKNGLYCSAAANLYKQKDRAAANCPDTGVCNPLCSKTLNRIMDTSGCCFIVHFNRTFQWDWLSHKFWQQCGLSSPGRCEPRFHNIS